MGLMKNPAVRKLRQLPLRASHLCRRVTVRPEQLSQNPPILCNSFPKSGTHLLLQVLTSLPNTGFYGSFLASVSPLTGKTRSNAWVQRRIRTTLPGECMPAHLYYSIEAEEELSNRDAIHYFIYRDPRDVVLSHVHYLTTINRWHVLHKEFASRESIEDRLLLSIEGLKNSKSRAKLPSIADRFAPYASWVDSPDVHAIRFESLVGTERRDAIRHIVEHWNVAVNGDSDRVESLTEAAFQAIDPKRSHTFRSGRTKQWETAFSPKVKDVFKEIASDLLIRLGYETDDSW